MRNSFGSGSKILRGTMWVLIILLGLGMTDGYCEPVDPPSNSSDDPVKLERIVVTATRSEKSADEVTADVAILTEEEIEAAPADNVDDILRRISGVDIRRPSDFGITSPMSINIRGVGGTKRILFMVDGVPTNSAITGFVNPNQIQLSAIERVEVVKGAYSSLYGSNAMGGVVNIITRERKEDGVDFTPMAKFGNEGLFETGTGVSGRSGKLAYTLNAGYRKIDNHYRRDDDVSYTFNGMTGGFDKIYDAIGDHTAYDDRRFFAKFSYELSGDTRITVSGNFAETATEMGYTTFLTEQREKDTDHMFYFLNVDAHTVVKDKIDLDLRGYTNYDRTDSNTEHILRNAGGQGGGMPGGMGGTMGGGTGSSMGGTMSGRMGGMGMGDYSYIYGKRNHRGRDVGAQIKAGMPIGEKHYLTAGIDSSFMDGYWKNKEEDGSLIGEGMDESINNQALYLQSESELFGGLIATLGARYDMNSESDNSFSPKLGLKYRLNDRFTFRSSLGRAFRAPNLNELYTPTWMMVPGIPFESNPDLEPEVVWSFDLGTTVRLTDRINFNLTGFYSKAEDLISNPITGGVMRYENLDEVETDGFEVGVDGRLLPWLSFYLNYTYTHSVDKETGRLDNQPLHQAGGGLLANCRLSDQAKMTTTLDVRYSGETSFTDMRTRKAIELDDWMVVDLAVSLKLFDKLGIKGAVTNIFNEDYEIHGSNLGPERSYWVSVDYTF